MLCFTNPSNLYIMPIINRNDTDKWIPDKWKNYSLIIFAKIIFSLYFLCKILLKSLFDFLIIMFFILYTDEILDFLSLSLFS